MRKAFIAVLISLVCSSAWGYEILSFLRYSRANDLEYFRNTVYVATDNGIITYDEHAGTFLNTYEKEKCLAGQYVYALISSEEADALIAFTDRGVYRFSPDGTWETLGDTLGKVTGTNMKNGRLYFMADRGGYYFDPARGAIYKGSEGPYAGIHDASFDVMLINTVLNRPVEVTDFVRTVFGDTVILTADGYLCLYDEFRYKLIYDNAAVFDTLIGGTVRLGGGKTVFFGNRLNIFDNGTFSFRSVPELDGNINDAAAVDGGVLFATRSDGLVYWREGVLRSIGTSRGLSDNDIRKVAYIGGYIYAVSRYGISYFTPFNTGKMAELKGMDYYNITDISGGDGYLVLLHKDRIVVSDMRGRNSRVILSSELFNDILLDAEYHDGSVYVAGNLGIAVYDINTNEKRITGAVNVRTEDILIENGRLFAATADGLYAEDIASGESWFVNEYDGLSGNDIKKLFPFENGIIVITEKSADYIYE